MPREDVEFRASASSPTSTCPPAWRLVAGGGGGGVGVAVSVGS